MGRLSDTVARPSQELCSLGRASVQRPPWEGAPGSFPHGLPSPVFCIQPQPFWCRTFSACFLSFPLVLTATQGVTSLLCFKAPFPVRWGWTRVKLWRKQSTHVVKCFAFPNSVYEHWWGWPLGRFCHFCVWRNWVLIWSGAKMTVWGQSCSVPLPRMEGAMCGPKEATDFFSAYSLQ